MDIRNAFASLAYAQARQAAPAAAPSTQPKDGASVVAGAAGSFAETLRAAEDTARSAMIGNADPHALIEALTSSQLAVETAVAVRDRVVEAYQEILRMPI